MIKFNICYFGKFLDIWTTDYRSCLDAAECMRLLGFRSARFVDDGNICYWTLSEEEYTWFVLRWS